MKKFTKIAALSLCVSLISVSVQAQSIKNGGFESNFSSWKEKDANKGVSISSIKRSGSKSVKFTKAGSVAQNIKVDKNTEYRIRGYIRGAARIRVKVNGKTFQATRNTTATNWRSRSVTFNSGSDEGAYLVVEYNGREGRVDDLSITKVSGGTSSSSSSSSSSTSSTSSSSGSFGLDKNKKPWQNFDLKDWALDTPEKDSSDGLALRTSDKDFANGNVSSKQNKWFFTHSDGGMRFVSFAKGAKTSSGTKFTRSELREMLRRGNTSISTTGETKNNWQLGYATTNSKLNGKNGKLTATLRVNRVTRKGDTSQRGRVIVGQIHASKNEPVRLYYRKLTNNSRGSVYWAHEKRNGSEKYYEIIGSRSSSQSNPSKGFALNELWSYEIINSGKYLEVIIRKGDRNGSIVARNKIDMDKENSDYDSKSEWMYFKAGAYTQNDTSSDSSDTDVVTFYRLANSH